MTLADLRLKLKHLRLQVFFNLVVCVGSRMRKRRMALMAQRMKIAPGLKVLDLGGQAEIWRDVPETLKITIVNLPDVLMEPEPGRHRFHFMHGDACDMHETPDQSYDLVFSNSVIEHVGGQEQQQAFAQTVRRVGKSYWVQTPSIWFPIEAHTGMPFWWFYPEALRQRLLRSWNIKTPAWADTIKGTRVLSRQHFEQMFPEAQIHVERVFGIPKSYTAWYCHGASGGQAVTSTR
jgi:Methyltransferase domain